MKNQDFSKKICIEVFCQKVILYCTEQSPSPRSGKCSKENGGGSKRNDFRKETFRPHFGLALLPCACGTQVRTLCVSTQEGGVLSKGKRRRRRSKEGGGGKGNSYLHDVVSLILFPPFRRCRRRRCRRRRLRPRRRRRQRKEERQHRSSISRLKGVSEILSRRTAGDK